MHSDQDLVAVKHYFDEFGSLPGEEWLAVKEKLTVRTYAAREFFQRPHQIPKNLGLVLSGIFRIYYQNPSGKEFTRAFSDEGKPIGDFASSLQGTEAKVSIEALEPSRVAVISFDDYFALFNRHSSWDRIGRKIIELYYVQREQREAEIAMMTARQRYLLFMNDHPTIAARATNAHVASYLNITPETLSRLRHVR